MLMKISILMLFERQSCLFFGGRRMKYQVVCAGTVTQDHVMRWHCSRNYSEIEEVGTVR